MQSRAIEQNVCDDFSVTDLKSKHVFRTDKESQNWEIHTDVSAGLKLGVMFMWRRKKGF